MEDVLNTHKAVVDAPYPLLVGQITARELFDACLDVGPDADYISTMQEDKMDIEGSHSILVGDSRKRGTLWRTTRSDRDAYALTREQKRWGIVLPLADRDSVRALLHTLAGLESLDSEIELRGHFYSGFNLWVYPTVARLRLLSKAS